MSITADQFNKALALWLSGMDTLAIARELDCSEADIWVITKPVPKPKIVKFPERKK